MKPSARKNWSRRTRQDKEKDQVMFHIKKVKVVGPRKSNAIPVLKETTVAATEVSKDPKIPEHQRRYLHVFYKSLVDCGKYKPLIMRELDEDWSFDENMDSDLSEAWRPVMDEPLLPFVIGRMDKKIKLAAADWLPEDFTTIPLRVWDPKDNQLVLF